ncbi:unnamed protein product [Parnassius apollo]|uniref:(apollo) hypothetical protein n=1 Tax=Parnassius apollo TaxID=110799 RepID=A0A8S3XN81_PARAO|nr:unnamed protein product [Parnassius apollo]
MDNNDKQNLQRYGRVMPRVYNSARSSLKASSSVIRHKSLARGNGAKPRSNSNNMSNSYSDLPIVLNDYIPDVAREKEVKPLFVVKPKKTLKSLVPFKNKNIPPRTVLRSRKCDNSSSANVCASAPSLLEGDTKDWSELHVRHCLSSRSHSRLKELKDEIHAYQETEKLMKLRSRLYKSCGVVLNDVGQVAVDKAVQAEEIDVNQKDARYV